MCVYSDFLIFIYLFIYNFSQFFYFQERQIPEDDARLKLVSEVFNYKRRRNMLGIE